MDVVDLGLVYEVEVEGPKVKVIHSLTSMGCPAGPMIQEGIHDAAAAVPGVEEVEVELTWDPVLDSGADVRRRQVHPRLRLSRPSESDSVEAEDQDFAPRHSAVHRRGHRAANVVVDLRAADHSELVELAKPERSGDDDLSSWGGQYVPLHCRVLGPVYVHTISLCPIGALLIPLL